jgi:hypothetical protein
MAEEVALSIKVNADQANQSVGSFKQQLREATAELVNMSMQFGEASAEAQAAAKKVAGLKDAIGDAKALADTFNPDKKFVALGGALQGATAGFSALQGAMGLFGGESKDVEKALLKVQSAMALQQGISGIAGALDSFKLLKNEIVGGVTKAFSTLRGAIIATGLGALAVGIGLLIANFDKVKQVVLNFIPGLAKVGEFVGNLINKVTDFIGVTSEAERAQERFIAASEKQLKAAKDFLDQEGYKYDEFTKRKIQADIDYKTKKLEIDKDTTMSEEEKNKALTNYALKRNFELDEADKARNKKAQDAEDEKNKKIKEKQDAAHKERLQKEKERAKEIADANKEQDKRQLDLQQEIYLQSIQDENARAQEKLRIQLENSVKEIEQTKATEKEKNETIKLLREKYNQDLSQLQFEQVEKQIAADIELNEKQAEARRQQDEKELEEAKKIAEEQKKIEEDIIKTIADIRQKDFDNRMKLLDAVGSGLTALSDIVGKETAAGKALAVASSLINTYAAIAGQLKAFSGVPVPGYAIAQAIVTGLVGFKAVRDIIKTPIPGGKGGGSTSGSVPTGAGVAPPPPQIQAVPQTTRIDQGQINQIGNAAVRSYVLETDVANNQERRIRIERAARIG